MPTTDVRFQPRTPTTSLDGVVAPPPTTTVSDVLGNFADRVGAPNPVAPRAPARPLATQEVKITDDGTLFLSKTGHLVPQAGLEQPRNTLEMGDTLFRASILAEADVNIFKDPRINLEQKGYAMTSLVGAFNKGNVEIPAMGGFQNKEQALQARSCAAALLLDLAESVNPARPEEAAFAKTCTQQYLRLLESEKHGLNRNFMIYDLETSKKNLPAEFRPVIDALMVEVAQTRPLYDEWFKDGNTKLKVDYHVGAGFWEEEVGFWQNDQGFARRDNGDGSVTLSKRVESNGKFLDVEMKMYNGPDAMFRKMNDANTHVVVYSGHANYGKNVTKRLDGAPPLVGHKVFFGLHCGGKGVHNEILDKWPELQVVQSLNSSYGYQDRRTLLVALQGFAERADWATISQRNVRQNSDNYYFPSDTLIRKRAEDRDNDGIFDAWDRIVSYNTFKPQASVNEHFTARDPGVAAARLDGRNLNSAVNRFLRIAGYNQWAQRLEDQRVLSNGFYEGTTRDPIFKITEERDDAGTMYKVELNKCFAHMSEESLGAVMHYELGKAAAERAGLPAADAKAAGLLMTAKCLSVDDGGLESEIFRGLCAFEKLPATLNYNEALECAKQDEHMSAGTARTLATYKEKLRARNVQL
jgi:hypothetical protein